MVVDRMDRASRQQKWAENQLTLGVQGTWNRRTRRWRIEEW